MQIKPQILKRFMTILYFDLITTLLFFLFIFYFVRKGINLQQISALYHQKIDQLIHQNYWLYVLPYFYSITFLSDFETYLHLKTQPIQLVYFFLLLIIQFLLFLKIQPLGVWNYGLLLRENLQKGHSKFMKSPDKDATDLQMEAFLQRKGETDFGLCELTFLLNSFVFPAIFILTNSFYFTKIISFIF